MHRIFSGAILLSLFFVLILLSGCEKGVEKKSAGRVAGQAAGKSAGNETETETGTGNRNDPGNDPGKVARNDPSNNPHKDPSNNPQKSTSASGFAGSARCRDCHKEFHSLWATSHHGLAMQPFTPEFAASQLQPQKKALEIGAHRFRADVKGGKGCVSEQGPAGVTTYPIAHVMGGKNIYYFLTPLTKGRLQVLPVAFDVRRREWFDTTASAVRHFPDVQDEALHWTERPYTFNTSCYSCHVSQLSTNYDLESDSYHTVWAEPGINCETCHGPSAAHIEACSTVPEGEAPGDLKIIRTSGFSNTQLNSMCAPCHAKMSAVTASFTPGDRYFDHYDLVTLEDPDFYPDGRDLGENYTYTLWRMNPCARSGELSCMHCHTSSGRFRFEKEPGRNESCLPCHKERVETVETHSHHPADSTGSRCIACHMPMTEFARMKRSDHSMLPPAPAATVTFKSPNACTICHEDKEPAWADAFVRKWYTNGYQASVLRRASLLKAARNEKWEKLPEMLSYLESGSCGEIYAASFIRLLGGGHGRRVSEVLKRKMSDPSPLVRSAAASALRHYLSPETVEVLLEAADDPVRLVRIRAAGSLLPVVRTMDGLRQDKQKQLQSAVSQYKASLCVRADDFASHYNLGNFYMDQEKLSQAVSSFKTALKLQPDAVAVLVNLSMAYARREKADEAEECLQKALAVDPESAPANFNMGLLKAEQGNRPAAEQCFRTALKTEPHMARAAYNLGILLSQEDLNEALMWCRKAYKQDPASRSYSYTLAFYLEKKGVPGEAEAVLENAVDKKRPWGEHVLLLGRIYRKTGRTGMAEELYRKALSFTGMPMQYLVRFRRMLSQQR